MSIPVGLQMYSLREACAQDFFQAIRDAAGAGYAGVEFAGFFDKPAAEVRKVVADAGLAIYGAHVGADLLADDKLDATVAYHRELGNTCLVVPWIPEERRNTSDACRRTAEWFTGLTAKLKAAGMQTGFHAHSVDVKPLADGSTPYAILMENTPAEFIMQIDVGNVVEGGACPAELLERYPGRATQIHLKERYMDKWNLPFGAGLVPWRKIFELAEGPAGTREYIVEVERYWDDPLECARQDRAILRTWGV